MIENQTQNQPVAAKKCVYTVVTGHYESLNSATVIADPNWDYICLTDNRELTSDTWIIRHFTPPFKNDHARNSRLPKTCPHRFLADYSVSLYIDNTVTLKVTPEEIERVLLPSTQFDWGGFRHSFRRTLLDEFNRVFQLSLDEPTRIQEQFITYKSVAPELLMAPPIWAGFLLRRHNDERVVAAGENWFSHILRYSRRDQLSLPFILDHYPCKTNLVDMDNRRSKLHEWNNKPPSRDGQRRRNSWKEMLPAGILVYYQAARLLNKVFRRKLKL